MFKKLLFKVMDPILSRLGELKNCHNGESCYIIGDGSSIKYFDMSAFSDKPAFSLNKIFYHKQSNLLNIKYGLFIEPFMFYPYFWDRDDATVELTGERFFKNPLQKIFRELIKKRQDVTFFTNLSNYPSLWDPNIYYLFQDIKDPNSKFFEECYLSGENIFAGSLRAAISLAIYMGFKEIFLIGCDYTHELSRSLHWYEKGKGEVAVMPEFQKSFLDIATKYVKITTITVEGEGSILPAITYNNFTGKKVLFKENYDLTDASLFKVLKSYQWYKNYL